MIKDMMQCYPLGFYSDQIGDNYIYSIFADV